MKWNNKLWIMMLVTLVVATSFVISANDKKEDLPIEVTPIKVITVEDKSFDVCLKSDKKGLTFTKDEPMTMQEMSKVYATSNSKGKNKECFVVTKTITKENTKEVKNDLKEIRKK